MGVTRHRSPWETEELVAVRDLARTFFVKEAAPLEEKFAEQGHPDPELWRRAGELGLLCTSIPEEYCGGGGTIAHDLVVYDEQLRAGAGAMAISVHSGIVAHYINAYGTEEQKRRWLPRMASGELIGAVAMSEPGAGSDLQNIVTRARRDGDEYVISGAKTFITNGRNAGLVVVVAKTDPALRAKGISLVVAEVDDGTPGFRRGKVLHKVGQHSTDTAELFFDEVRVPAANLLGPEEGRGFAQLMDQLPQERLIIASLGLTWMEAALAMTVEYVTERQAFGGPLMALQNTRFELAECATVARVCRVFLDDCVARHLRGELDAVTASMAKYWITDRQTEVVDRCVQLHGGYGYMLEYPIGRIFADGRVQRIYGGANEVMKELIARSL
ncbi:acyl-CoA dehydrogenase family protein [Streptomyces sp. YKOK-I1]